MARHEIAFRHITQYMHRRGGLQECSKGLRLYSGQAAGPSGQEQNQQADDETPPSAASTVGLMAVGALGAIGIAAVGVYGVLQISLMVAQGTGRSIMADKQKQEAEQQARSQPPG